MKFSLVLSALAGLALADLIQRDTKGTDGTKVAAGHPDKVVADQAPCCSAIGVQGVLHCTCYKYSPCCKEHPHPAPV
ncbi:hypothetical protein E4U19_007556 [Claviceps sp. Clav32 group G5]|nr:hypothetical protein E4U40_002428 [Claviceps sp. LM458 group G5]KAG6039058.1 hypothetical protein E4U19_007556 [Claviceps sp. Clav32 group G5]KAG6051599.1 hypothetical protein E4U39_000427 [Claviceps sp. Clav50 group G5]